MRIAICDDDAQTLELMQSYVSRYAESRSKTLHAECFQTPDKLLALLQQNEYNNFDVIFINISMPGRSGIEVASIIRNHNFNIYIVFITGLLNHMPDAFRLHAFDYISKPISISNVFRVLDDLTRSYPTLTVISDRSEVSISANQILYIESLGKKAVIKTFGGDYPTYISQKSLIANLPKSFIQCHKSYIINMQMVKKRNAANCMLVNDSVIPIGRKYMHVFKDAYFRYLLDSGRNL